jgi:hypothetical protein
MRHLIVVVLLCLLPLAVKLEAEDLFSGEWKLNSSRSQPPANAAQTRLLQIESDEARVALIEEGIDAKGQPSTRSIRAAYGGNLAGVLDLADMHYLQITETAAYGLRTMGPFAEGLRDGEDSF